jgi:predicted secreted protein
VSFGSALAVYFLFLVFTAFLMLPFGMRTDEEAGVPRIAGQADSAPHSFDLRRHLLRAGLIAAVLFALFYANWTQGWITAEMLDFYN